MDRREFLVTAGAVAAATAAPLAQPSPRRLLYVAQPGIRNYQQYGGVGVLVYDIDRDHAFVKRIPTWHVAEGAAADKLLKLIPYGRIGDVEDVAALALFMASDLADYMTGTTVYVDGGMTLYPGFEDNG